MGHPSNYTPISLTPHQLRSYGFSKMIFSAIYYSIS